MCDLIKLSSIFTIAPCWLWSRGSTEPPSHMELVETSRWRVRNSHPEGEISFSALSMRDETDDGKVL